MTTPTANFSWAKPVVGADSDTWGTELNALADAIDAQVALYLLKTGGTITGAITYGGVTLANAVTGTGSMVLSASPTLTGTLSLAAALLNSVGLKALVNAAVSTGAATITSNSTAGGAALVYGTKNGSSNNFFDLVTWNASRATVTLTGSNGVEVPDTRTYDVSGNDLRVAMGANTYSVQTIWMPHV